MAEPDPKQTVSADMARLIAEQLDNMMSDRMGQLHNRFVGYVSESGLPLMQVALVLQILLAETISQASKKYLGE